jgi:hypothetical protein
MFNGWSLFVVCMGVVGLVSGFFMRSKKCVR